LTYSPILFELDYEGATLGHLAHFQELSRFPQVRRDISFTVDAGVSFNALRDRVRVAASARLREITVFDVYQGDGVESGRKSIALGLILQDFNRTLTDEDADRVVAGVVAELRAGFDARIRE
jgi:phenylalanyl-tRNA synthetase beta chain